MKLLHLIPTILLFGSSIVVAHQPMDTSNSIMERDILSNSLVASFGEIDTGFSPRAHHPRSIFQKRQVCNSQSDNICTQQGNIIRCCPDDYTCFWGDGDWRCDPNILGLSRGQKIGIAIGVVVAVFVLGIVGLAIFCFCCRKVVQAATSSGNNNNQGVYIPPQQPVMYGHTGQGYDPAAIPLAHVGGEGKPYTDNTGYYPPPPQQGGYDPSQYGQQQYPPPPPGPPPPGLYPQTTTPAPPTYQQQQPPPPQAGFHQ